MWLEPVRKKKNTDDTWGAFGLPNLILANAGVLSLVSLDGKRRRLTSNCQM
jgi:hypothetical protein